MEIIVLGTGCVKCQTTYDRIKKVITETGCNATVIKVDDIMEILKYNVLVTPAVVVDGKIRIKGSVPSEKEIKAILEI